MLIAKWINKSSVQIGCCPVMCATFYNICEPRLAAILCDTQNKADTQTGRKAEQGHWRRQMNLKGKTNCAHGQQQEKDKCKNVVKKKGVKGKKGREPVEWETFRNLHPSYIFKWLGVAKKLDWNRRRSISEKVRSGCDDGRCYHQTTFILRWFKHLHCLWSNQSWTEGHWFQHLLVGQK